MDQEKRRAQIEAAAYELLARKGYAGTSMLSVARAAKASNETLYRWYGDKAGLFSAMIARNAESVADALEEVADASLPLEAALERVGRVLLTLLTGERSVALNRAAAADASGALGAAIAAGGRSRIVPLVGEVFARAMERGEIAGTAPGAAADLWVSLLVGDLQIRRAIGAMDVPPKDEVEARAALAARRVSVLLA